MHIYRLSSGIVRPTIYTTTEEKAFETVRGAKMVYEKTLDIVTEYTNSYRDTYINYRVFNKKSRKDKMDLNAKSI